MSSPDKRQETVRVKGEAAEGSTGSLTGWFLGRREIPGGLSSGRTECCHDRRDQEP